MPDSTRRRLVPKFRTIRGRLLFSILAVAIPVYASALYVSYRWTEERLKADAERDADELAAQLAAGMDAVIRPIEGGIRTVASQLEEIDPPREQYALRIRGILAAWPDVYGSTIAVEAGRGDGAIDAFAPYLFRRAGEIAYADLARESYAYSTLPWYRLAADSHAPVWSLPYFDDGGGDTWMVTYSVPFYRKRGDSRVLSGVVTADLDLAWVEKAAADVALGAMGMGWLASPPSEASFVAPVGATSERLPRFDAALRAHDVRNFGERMLARHQTFERLPHDLAAQPAYLAVRDLKTLDWRLMLIVPQSDILAAARDLLRWQLLLGAAGLAVLVGAVSLVAGAISRPIHALADSVGTASEDHLTFALPDSAGDDEVGTLTQALRRMRDSLQRHIHLRAESLAAQARLEHELEIAASIQQSMLPKRDAATIPGAAIAAVLVPAKQVGGDLYDYFGTTGDRLLFAVADVSDKGIPAALYMARLSSLLRVLGASGASPDRLLAELNSRLVEDNDACMFVTMGCGLLNLATGHLQYASAGHDPPLLRDAGGTVRELAVDNGAALGIERDTQYRAVDAFVAPGDALVVFTDGVTEARANDGSPLGPDGLAALLREEAETEPDALVRRVVDTMKRSGLRVEDDLTVLAVSLNPMDVSIRRSESTTHWLLEPEPSPAGVRRAQQRLRAILAARGVAAHKIEDAELIAEELLTNVVRSFGSRGGRGHLSIDCVLQGGDVVLTFSDDAAPFDPLAAETSDLDAPLEQRRIGGLGIALVRRLADGCRYDYVNGRNVLEVRLHSNPT